jgi:hypothetical protein
MALPCLILTVIGYFDSVSYISRATMVAAGMSTVMGPWTTQVLRITDYPNAGSLFDLPLALGLTAALAGIVAALFVVTRRWLRWVFALLYPAIVSWWYWVAALQLIHCAS